MVPGQATPQTVGQIQVANFVNPAGLDPKGQNIFAETAASGTATSGAPGTNGAGTLRQGFVETSNVNVVEELGADAYVYGELVLSGEERKEIIVRTDGRRPPMKGDVVHATVKEGHSHVFSPATGLRLS